MCKLFALGLLGLLSSWAPGQEKKDEPAIPPFVAQKALQWMQDSDPEKREAAYRTFQLYGDEGGAIYRRTLTQARRLHHRKLSRLLDDERFNPFLGLPVLHDSLKKERERIDALIKTDYQKDPGKIAMLRREVESLAKLNDRIRKMAAKDNERLANAIEPVATALAEVMREIKLIDEEAGDDPITPEAALQDSFEGIRYLETKKRVTRIKQEMAEEEAARRDNEACDWANPSQKDFTRILNESRALFALTPLRLEERLSEAATGHSRDMATVGFFAHQSPVPGKKSPGDRARLAGFKHRWSGENIFAGSGSPDAAYQAWFASDGHRFIMFARGPNLIGVGPHGKHWTMMTGTK